MNGRDDVHPATRRRVLEAAERLSFVTRRGAQSKARTASRSIGIITDDPSGRFSMGILNGAEDAFDDGSVSVELCFTRRDPIREQHYISTLVERGVDGVIVIGETSNYRRSITKRLSIPTVYALCTSDDDSDISHGADDVLGGAMATEHLLSLGRRRIAHITGPKDYLAADERSRGVARALDESGLERVGDVLHGTWWTQQWGRTATQMLLATHPDVDAIVCGNDQIAVGAIDVLRASGRTVPGDVSIVGFDNWLIFSEDADPPLTTVDLRLETIGRRAARALFDDGKDSEPGRHLHKPRLVLRESASYATRPVTAR